MPYPERLLTTDELIIRQFRPHWRMLIIPVLWALAAIAAIVVVFVVIPPDDTTVDLIVTGVLLLALVRVAVWPFIQWWFTLYVLTDHRLIHRRGVIARKGIEISLEDITNVILEQNPLERILRSGDLTIESAGESGQSPFYDIPEPEAFQSLLSRVREDRKRDLETPEIIMPAAPAAPTSDPGERLERLNRLHTDGLITDEEYEEKRKSLLDEI